MFRRWFLFALVNIAIVVMISLVLNLLGVAPYLNQYGLDYNALLVFSLVWGMAGSFISLLMSKQIAKWTMGVKLVEDDSRYASLVNLVHNLARTAGLKKMPQVGVYPGMEMNAFATGPGRNNSLVAVSEGLLRSMNHSEMEGVIGHEIAHISNGDMVTMTLIQGVVNAFVIFFARIAAFAVQQFLSRSDDDERSPVGGFAYMILVFAFEIFFGILGSLVTAWFSRSREYRADAGSARYAGRQQMISALKRLGAETVPAPATSAAMSHLKISSGKRGNFLALFATHPPLEQRIAALESASR